MRRALIAACAVLALLPGAGHAGGGRALDHLEGLREPRTDGIPLPGATPAQARAVREWTVIGLAGGGRDPGAAVPGRAPAATALTRVPRVAGIPLARWAVAAAAARRVRVADRRVAQRRLGAGVRDDADPLTLAWTVLGLRALGRPPGDPALRRAAALLRAAQAPDGGWASRARSGPDVPATAAAVQALVALGVPRGDTALERARAWMLAARRGDGGFPPVPGDPSTGLDTSWGTLAVWALGESPSAAPWTAAGRGPLDRLTGLQRPDGGVADAPRGPASPVVTALAARAFRGAPLPGAPPPRGAAVDPAPVVVRRSPAPGQPPRRTVVVLVRDDAGGTGVDPLRTRLFAAGRDVTARARVTPFSLQIPADALGALPVGVRLDLVDRAGNRRIVRWSIGGVARPQERPRDGR